MSLCPLQTFRDDPGLEGRAFMLHANWRRGILPEQGAAEDQPNLVWPVIFATEMGSKAGEALQQEIARDKAEKQSRGGRGKGKPRHTRGRR